MSLLTPLSAAALGPLSAAALGPPFTAVIAPPFGDVIAPLLGTLLLLVTTTVVGLLLRRRTGRVREFADPAGADPARGNPAGANPARIYPADLGLEHFGERGTVVQFSTEFCSRCPGVRRLLSQRISGTPGIEFVHAELTHDPDLARRFGVLQTPTILFIDAAGHPRKRLSGQLGSSTLRLALDEFAATAAKPVAFAQAAAQPAAQPAVPPPSANRSSIGATI